MPASKKKSTAKKPAVKRTVVRSRRKATPKSFGVAPNDKPFMSFRVTQQTFYWTVLLIFVLIVQVWVLNMQIDVTNLLNEVETQISTGP